MKTRSLIVAYGEDSRVIGDGKHMPTWDLLDDRIFFKKSTREDDTIMGRKNYESLPDDYRPLPDRGNTITTRDTEWKPKEQSDTILVVHSLWEALMAAEKSPRKKISIIGGGEIYRLALNTIVFDEIHITRVKGWFEGSVTFPRLPFSLQDNYEITYQQQFLKKKDRNSHDFVITSYKRKTLL